MSNQKKVSDAQVTLLSKLYLEQGKNLTPAVKDWIKNLPQAEGSMYIDKWIEKNRKRQAHRKSWYGSK